MVTATAGAAQDANGSSPEMRARQRSAVNDATRACAHSGQPWCGGACSSDVAPCPATFPGPSSGAGLSRGIALAAVPPSNLRCAGWTDHQPPCVATPLHLSALPHTPRPMAGARHGHGARAEYREERDRLMSERGDAGESSGTVLAGLFCLQRLMHLEQGLACQAVCHAGVPVRDYEEHDPEAATLMMHVSVANNRAPAALQRTHPRTQRQTSCIATPLVPAAGAPEAGRAAGDAGAVSGARGQEVRPHPQGAAHAEPVRRWPGP